MGQRGARYVPSKADRETVKNLSLLGSNEKTIAKCLGAEGIALDTLRKYFEYELKRHRNERLGKLANVAFTKAEAGDTTMLCFILKTQGHWSEKSSLSIDGELVIKRVIGVPEDRI